MFHLTYGIPTPCPGRRIAGEPVPDPLRLLFESTSPWLVRARFSPGVILYLQGLGREQKILEGGG